MGPGAFKIKQMNPEDPPDPVGSLPEFGPEPIFVNEFFYGSNPIVNFSSFHYYSHPFI